MSGSACTRAPGPAARGRPRQRPEVVLADRGHDHDTYRHLVRQLQVRPLITRRGTGRGSGPGEQRWVVEQTLALLQTCWDEQGAADIRPSAASEVA
ncbi:hypothetical protein [Streptosporangium pseudovulgare]|uniref:hypothetical protein n=1 Tax=Streptosporangium pseudovulgare TaxID=35765 RepID=UPI001E44805C|nr:hypothetical protein [Streptosporangium pseudovulgare]